MNQRRINIYLILLILFFCFHFINNYIWVRSNNSTIGVDVSNHLFFSIEFFYQLSDILSNTAVHFWDKLVDIIKLLNTPVGITNNVYWPRFVNLCASVFYFIFGKSLLAVKSTMLVFLFILLVATYLIGKQIVNRFVGICAAFIVSMYPMIFESSRQYALDFPLTAMVTLTILFLIQCENFKNRKYAILLGLSLGISMLVKGQAIIFITAPLCAVLIYASKEISVLSTNPPDSIARISLSRKIIYNFILFVIVAGLIASIWWADKLADTVLSLREHADSTFSNFLVYTGFFEIRDYSQAYLYSRHLVELSKNSLGYFFFLIFCIAFIFFIRAKVKYKSILLSWILFPFLLFSFILLVKHGRFLMPIFPALALITAWGIYRIKNRKFRYLSLAAVVIFALIQFFMLSYSRHQFRNISIGPIRIFGGTLYGEGLPYYKDFRDLQTDEIVGAIRKEYPADREVKLGLIDFDGLPPYRFERLFWLRLKDRFIEPIDLAQMHAHFLRDFYLMDCLLFCPPPQSTLVWPKGEKFKQEFKKYYPIKWLEHQFIPSWTKVFEKLENSESKFELLRKIERDNGPQCYIYKRR